MKNSLNFEVDASESGQMAIILDFHYSALHMTYAIDTCQAAHAYCIWCMSTLCNMQAPPRNVSEDK